MSAFSYQAPQSGLFDEPVADVLFPGQWRLARIELVNWGTFNGYHSLDVSRQGLLITGESGSGKSSLLDAVASVLTPARTLRFNAAAQSEGHAKDRNLYTYIRGAWNRQADDAGEVASAYLRPKAATWSGVLLRYECGLPRDAMNLVALYHLKANSTSKDGLSRLYVIVNGDCALLDLKPYVENGVDTAALNKDLKGMASAWRDHGPFAARFRQRMGMRSEKTLELLHRTQAAKNFGSLDDLFRRFMLDEPETFEQKKAAIEQFSALQRAYDGVVDQRRQMEALKPLVEESARHEKAQAKRAEVERLGRVLTAYTEQRAIASLAQRQEACRRDLDRLAGLIRDARSEYALAEQAYAQAQAVYDGAGGFALDVAEADCLACERQVGTVQGNRDRLQAELAVLGMGDLPDAREGWGELVRRVQRAAAASARERRESIDADYEQYSRVRDAKARLASLDEELRHLRAHRTNIPKAYDDVRRRIAKELGVSAAELPFVGELITVRDEFAAWQGAIERVLSSQAKTLLVAHPYVQAVARFVDGEHLGLRFECEDVPEGVEVPAAYPSPRSLIKRLEVAQHPTRPEYTRWVNRLIREKFDYICVDSTDELADFRQALTAAGQVKSRERYIKDDRYRVDDQSRWVLGASNEGKIEALEREQRAARDELSRQEAAARAVDEARRHADDLQRLDASLGKEQWESYDLASAQRDLAAARSHCEALKRNSSKLAWADEQREQAAARRSAADEALRERCVDEREARRRLDETIARIANHEQRLSGRDLPTADQSAALAGLFAKAAGAQRDLTGDEELALYQTSAAVAETLTKQASAAADELRKSGTAMNRVIDTYRRQWPAPSADLGGDYEAREEYLSIYRNIEASGLPSFEQEFLKVLNDFSQEQITVIATTIRDAFREVKDKIRQVNASLALSEYAPGVHLQIDVRDCRSKRVNDFLSDLRAIAQGSYNNTDFRTAEERYKRTAGVMARLQSADPEDVRWCQECLDTRRHVTFRAKEIDDDGVVQSVHDSDAGLSGGQKQKLVIFCLAAALRYQLADEDNPVPTYGTVMLDEAFDKADHRFAATAMDIFEQFGFQMVLATPMKLLQAADDHVGGVAYVHCRDRKYSTVQLLSFEEDGGEA